MTKYSTSWPINKATGQIVVSGSGVVVDGDLPEGFIPVGDDGGVLLSVTGGGLLQSAQKITVTGTTSPVVVAKKTIPAGLLGLSDIIRVEYIGSCNNSVNDKAFRVIINSQMAHESVVTTSTTLRNNISLAIRSSSSIVTNNVYGGPSFGNGYSGSVAEVLNLDTTGEISVSIVIDLADGADTASIETFSITYAKGIGTNEA